MARPAIEFAKKYFKKEVDIIAEVGVRTGGHAHEMYIALKPRKIYLIDVYKTVNDGGPDSRFTEEDHIRWYKEAHIHTKDLPNAHFILKASQVAALYVPNNLDLVYIDASHIEYDVIIDIACWYPKIRIGGIICGHDYSPNNSVGIAVNRMFKDISYKETDWWIVKQQIGYGI